jgi:hypothetical protein
VGAHTALTELGEAGRRSYLGFRVADLIFLLIYAVALSGLIFRLFGARQLVWLPVATMVFDVLEDIGLFVALSEYPAPSSTVLTLASVAGVFKNVNGVPGRPFWPCGQAWCCSW